MKFSFAIFAGVLFVIAAICILRPRAIQEKAVRVMREENRIPLPAAFVRIMLTYFQSRRYIAELRALGTMLFLILGFILWALLRARQH